MKIALLILLSIFSLDLCAQDTLRLSLLFTGDIMQHESQISAAYDTATSSYAYEPCFQHIKPLLTASDLTIGNLELTLGGKPYAGYPQFSAPDALLPALRKAGFDVLVTANNHSADRGQRGLERTVDMLDSVGMLHTGTFRDTVEWLNNHPLIIQRNGMCLSLLNYTYGTNSMPVYYPNLVNHIDTLRIRYDLMKAKAQRTDAVIVFFHWGEEYKSVPSAIQKDLAEFCFRMGVKIVVGSHPHVLQPMEWRRETDQLVVYSLGNFISGQRARYRNGGAMLHLELKKITGTDGASVTTIDSASYSLAWVFRAPDQRRSFQIIPIPEGEPDTTLVRSATSRQLMLEFIEDSRTFLRKENRGIDERKLRP